MANIAIVGSGNVGANTAFFIAERNTGDVWMYDVQEGLSQGKALDMMEAAPIRGYQFGIHAAETLEQLLDSAALVVAAGKSRSPGMTRDALYESNAALVEELGTRFRGYGGVAVIATEPVDLMVMHFVHASQMDPSRVIGLGGVLDSTRLTYLLAAELGISAENVTSTVIGRHSEHMVPLLDYCRVGGVSVPLLLDEQRLDAVVEKMRTAGDVIVSMAQHASSYYGPSAAAADVVQAIVWNTHRVLPVSFVWRGHYGIAGVAMSLPAVLGAGGVQRVLEPKLTAAQIEQIRADATHLEALYKQQ